MGAARKATVAIECKWSADGFDSMIFLSFAPLYPLATLIVVTADVERPDTHPVGGLKIRFVGRGGRVQKPEARRGSNPF